MRIYTVGQGTRPLEELVETLARAGVQTLVDVRRFPGSRRNPQFNRGALAAGIAAAGIAPCFLCAETAWQRCHRRLIAELLTARGHEVVHLIRPGEREPHRVYDESEIHDGLLYLCGELVA